MTCRASLTFDEALAILRGAAGPLGVERVPLDKAGRRVLAEPVIARLDMPRYDAAAMDGHALAGALSDAGARVVGTAYPGQAWAGQIGANEAVRIMTGAAVPAGADRIIPLELVREADGTVWPAGQASSRSHIRPRGCDMMAGREVLPVGTLLDPRALLTAAAADMADLACWRRPAVSVIASGDELVPPGRASLGTGAVPDSLSSALLLLARQWGARPVGGALVNDDMAAIRAAAEAALAECDVLVLAGGASRGDRDFARAALVPLGLELRFADVAMKPGKPVWYGRVGDRHVLGLPGNPTAAMTVARLFLAPLLRALGGRDFDGALRWREQPLVGGTATVSARDQFLCARQVDQGAAIIDRQSASDQAMLAQADLLARVKSDTAPAADTMVSTLAF